MKWIAWFEKCNSYPKNFKFCAIKKNYCITYTLQLNLTKLNLDGSLSVRRIFQFSVVKTLPCPGCFTACMSVYFTIVKLRYADRMTDCDMVPNGFADSIEFQLTSLGRIEVLAYSFDTDFNYGLFWQYFSNKGDGKGNDSSICWDLTVFKGINIASLNSI